MGEVKGWDKVGLTLFDNQLVAGLRADTCGNDTMYALLCCASFGAFNCCVVQA